MTLTNLNQYGKPFQIKVLSSLLTHKGFLTNIHDILSEEYFDNQAHKWVINEILDYYEGYFKEKIAYMNLFVNMPPSPEEMQEIQKQVKDTLDNLRKEQIVQLEEQKLKLTQAVEQGEMIQERAILEIEKMQNSMEAELEQRKIVLLSQMEESRTRVENRVVTEFEYNIMKQDENLVTNIVDAVKFYENRIKMCVVVGDKLLYETILNVKEYPIIPFVYQQKLYF